MNRPSQRAVVGWREWVALPQLGVTQVKAKVDTGARSSSLHAFEIEELRRDGVSLVRFTLRPAQGDTSPTIRAEHPLLEYRKVRSSNGQTENRPVIETEIELDSQRWLVELTLTSRDEMGFRMLIGRQAVRGRFLIDAGRSFVASKRRKSNRRRQQGVGAKTP